jgi:hypothetical protein
MNHDYREVILKQREGRSYIPWEGTTIDYLKKVKEHPEICNFSPGRIYEMVMKHGTADVDPVLKTRGSYALLESGSPPY